MTILKTFFSSSPAIFFCLNVMYWVDDVSVFLIYKSTLFIKKKIFIKATLLTYFRYFLDYLQFCLIKARKAKVAKDNLAKYYIKGIFAKNILV